jgi:hypothetical protein
MFIFTKYKLNESLSFVSNYQPVNEGFVGTSVSQYCHIVPLLDHNNGNIVIGKIQFINTCQSVSTYPSQFFIEESIMMHFNDGSSIFASNYYEKTGEMHYKTGDKIILPIVSSIGRDVGKKGYIVIDVHENIRDITIRLDEEEVFGTFQGV